MVQPEVTVCVLTYRRATLLGRLLGALRDQVREYGAGARLLVVDNDPAGSAADVAGQHLVGADRYVVELVPGISAARNRALAECGTDLLVFIDDDELPTARWLVELVECWRRFRPAAVVGPVHSVFPTSPHPFVKAGDFLVGPEMATGTRVKEAATNNLLLHTPSLRAAGLVFDPDFGLSGGSDSVLTRQLTHMGQQIVWCQEALVTEEVPDRRNTAEWVLRRSFRDGNTSARVSARLAGDRPGLARLGAARAGVLRLAVGVPRAVWGTATGSLRHQARGLRTSARGWGLLSGAVGYVYVEYARRGGEVAGDNAHHGGFGGVDAQAGGGVAGGLGGAGSTSSDVCGVEAAR